MSVLHSIIEGVREDLAARRLPMGQLQEALEIAEALDLACQERSAVVIVCDSVGSFPGISELSQG